VYDPQHPTHDNSQDLTRQFTWSNTKQFTRSDTQHDKETLLYAKRLSVRDFSGGSCFTRATWGRPASWR